MKLPDKFRSSLTIDNVILRLEKLPLCVSRRNLTLYVSVSCLVLVHATEADVTYRVAVFCRNLDHL